MEYTKGEWKVYESPFAPAVIIKEKPNRPDRIIAICRLERGSEGMAEATANANLIAAAVNACQAINPDNPIAAAAALKDLYEELKELREWIQSNDVKFLGKGFTEQFGIPKTFGKVDKAIAKAEGK